ncbi:MAG: DUF2851 family protein [Saprospiraceae bacterium]
MREDYLHYVWNTHQWHDTELRTTNSQIIEILDRGTYNKDQGPDFQLATVNINGIIWAGHVEMHVRSSDWNRHRHQNDPRYHNVILHVVWEHDTDVACNDRILPTLELREYISGIEMDRYAYLFDSVEEIPCRTLLTGIPAHIINSQFETVGIQRMIDKTDMMIRDAENLNGDFEALYFQYICRYLVTPPNTQAMDLLLQKISWKQLSSYQDDLNNLEALFFGVSGLLPDSDDEYITDLNHRFRFIRHRNNFINLPHTVWNFLRLRPSHFPTLRLAQICSYFHHYHRPLSFIIESHTLQEVLSHFGVIPSSYWSNHFQFSKISKSGNHMIGKTTRTVLMINVVVPILYAYGSVHFNKTLQEKSLLWMGELKAENNRYTRMWRDIGIDISSARFSQACIHQYKQLCSVKKCIDCRIGHHILSKI